MMFRGASADAVAALTEELGTTVSGSSERASTVADDLFAVAGTLRSEGALRRFLSDASVPVQAKEGLVSQVLGAKIDAASLALVTSAARRRWTSSRDLGDALEHLGVVASVSAEQDPSRLEDELFAFAQAVKTNGDLRDALSDPARSQADKRGLVRSLLEGKALPATVRLAEQSVSGVHRTVSVALTEYQKVAAEVRGQGVATVRVARPLSDGEERRLAEVLSSQYGRPVHLNTLVDPSVIGGIRVEIGDDVIDGTVSTRLDDARRRLVG